MSDSEEECDFQEPVNVPVDIYTRKRNRSHIESLEYEETEEDLIEASVCSLCQCVWTNNGIHGIVGLKCGHVFGKNCIEHHIRDSIIKCPVAKCPICDHTLTKVEPRRIWPNKVIPCNEKDLISLRKEHEDADRIIEELKEANKAIMQQIDQAKFDLTLLQSEDKSNKLSSQISIQTVQVPQPPKFIHQRTFSLASEKYRIIDLDPLEDRAVLSVWKNVKQQYGLRKINLYDTTLTEFIPNHSGIIKDLKHTSNDMILSTGLDKTLKLTSLLTNQVVQSYQLGAPGWSCATSDATPSIVYCGLTNNTVLVFDIRNTKESVHKLIEPCTPKIFSPIHSMEVVTNDSQSMLMCSNLVHSYGWNTSNEDYEYIQLEQSTECTFDATDQYKSFAMAYRDNVMFSSLRNKSSTRYEVGHFDESLKLQLDWYYDDLYHKQNLLSRNIHFTRDEQVYICFSDNDTVKIRNQTGEVQRIKVNGPIADIKYIKEQQVLTILTEDELRMYKFAPPTVSNDVA